MIYTDLFPEKDCTAIQNWYPTHERAAEKLEYRKIPPQKVKTVFYGDSITYNFQYHEFFPGISFMNRGVPGDRLTGLYSRLEQDLYPYQPEQVVLHAGINGIFEDNEIMLAKFEAISDLIVATGAKVYLCSVLPLRHGDQWNRFQYQDKIAALNKLLAELAGRKYSGFLDYHSAVKDEAGELAEKFAKPDGTHITFYGYCAMAEVLKKSVNLY